MTKLVSISYSLNPPEGTNIPSSHESEKTLAFPMKAAEDSKQFAYYSSLRDAILEAKTKIGQDMTAWRDAVGILENAKEVKKVKEDSEDDDEDEE